METKTQAGRALATAGLAVLEAERLVHLAMGAAAVALTTEAMDPEKASLGLVLQAREAVREAMLNYREALAVFEATRELVNASWEKPAAEPLPYVWPEVKS